MLSFLFLSIVVVAVRGVPQGLTINTDLDNEWETYKTTFGKKYDDFSHVARRLIWEQNVKYIQQHNIEYDLGIHTYTLGVNEFADMTHEEFKAIYLSYSLPNMTASARFLRPLNTGPIPDFVDWRQKGYVTPVKNQGRCGSCWAFSTTGSMEGQYFRSKRRLLSFSEQQLVDCSQRFGNNGCNGGLMNNAFTYIGQAGLEQEQSYPYTAKVGRCKYDRSKVMTFCRGFVNVDSGDEEDLACAVATVGPISVAIDAGHRSFQLYRNGVYNEPACSSTALDHGVLVVGYGNENGQYYWLVKNSWGPVWGMNGYIKMRKDANNQCGIATMASYPQI